MARYRIYCIGASGNSYKLALYMNCAGLDWEPVGVDFAGGETRDPDWRANTNAMGEVPVLEADGQLMSQSGAILVWLAETTGKFAPDAEQRYEALRWIMFDNHKFTSYFATWRFMKAFAAKEPDPTIAAFLRGRIDSAFFIVEKHLTGRSFIVGDSFSIADISLSGYLFFRERGITDAVIAASVMFCGVLILYLPLTSPQALGMTALTLAGMSLALYLTRNRSAAVAVAAR